MAFSAFNIIKDELSQVNQELIKSASNYDGLAAKAAKSCLVRSGKRLRPGLVILSAKIFGPVNKSVIKVAALVEIVHLASLLHDDVVDNAKLRRGKPAINILFGNKVSVLLADYLLAESLYFLCKQEYLEILRVLTLAVQKMSLGQLQEIDHQNNFSINLDQYKEIINNKTASLISAACQIGAILSGADSKYIGNLSRYGQNLGMAFQISDDILDFWGKSHRTGKSTGLDISQKNFTAPLIYTFKEAKTSDKKVLIRLLSDGKIRTESFKKIISLMDKYKVKEKVQDLARGCSGLAQDQISGLPDNSSKKALLNLVSQVVCREK